MSGYNIKLSEDEIKQFQELRPEFSKFPQFVRKYQDPDQEQYPELFVFCGWAAFAAGMRMLNMPMTDHDRLSMQKIQDETDTDLMLGTFTKNPHWASGFNPNLQLYFRELEFLLTGVYTNNTLPISRDRTGALPYFLKIKCRENNYDVSLQRESLSTRLTMSGQFFIDLWKGNLIFRDKECYEYFQRRQIYTPELKETIEALVLNPTRFEDKFPARKLEAIIKNMIRLRLIGWTLSEHDKQILTPWIKEKDEKFESFMNGFLPKLESKLELKKLLKENGFADCWMDILIQKTTYESAPLIKYHNLKSVDAMVEDIEYLIAQDSRLCSDSEKNRIFNHYMSEVEQEKIKLFLSHPSVESLFDTIERLIDKTQNPIFRRNWMAQKRERVSVSSASEYAISPTEALVPIGGSADSDAFKLVQFSAEPEGLIKIKMFENEIERYNDLGSLENFYNGFFDKSYLDHQQTFSAEQVKPDYALFGLSLLSLSWVVYEDLLKSKSLSISLFLVIFMIFFMQILGLRIKYAQNVNKSLSKIYLEQAKKTEKNLNLKNQNLYAVLVCLLLDMARNKIEIDIQLEDGKASVTQQFFSHLFTYAKQFLSANETDITIKKLILNLMFISQEDHATKGHNFFTDPKVKKRYSDNGLKNDVPNFEQGLQKIIDAVHSKNSEQEIIRLFDNTFSHVAWAAYRKDNNYEEQLEKAKVDCPGIAHSLDIVYRGTVKLASGLVRGKTPAAESVLVLNKPFWCLFAIKEYKNMLGVGGLTSFLWALNQERSAYFEKRDQNPNWGKNINPPKV